MKTFYSVGELKPYLKEETNTYVFKDSINLNFNLKTTANIKAYDIEAWNIDALDIKAQNIDARNIDALDIKAQNIDVASIDAREIYAHNIEAVNIDARNIKAHNIYGANIEAVNIEARNISYYAFCIAHRSFTCESVKGRRDKSIHTCLDGDIVIRKPKQTVTLKLTEEQLDKIKELLEESK